MDKKELEDILMDLFIDFDNCEEIINILREYEGNIITEAEYDYLLNNYNRILKKFELQEFLKELKDNKYKNIQKTYIINRLNKILEEEA